MVHLNILIDVSLKHVKHVVAGNDEPFFKSPEFATPFDFMELSESFSTLSSCVAQKFTALEHCHHPRSIVFCWTILNPEWYREIQGINLNKKSMDKTAHTENHVK